MSVYSKSGYLIVRKERLNEESGCVERGGAALGGVRGC